MKEATIICQIQDFEADFFMERKPQKPEIRNNPENFTRFIQASLCKIQGFSKDF